MKKKKKKKYIPPKIDLLGEEDATTPPCAIGSAPTCDHGCVIDCSIEGLP